MQLQFTLPRTEDRDNVIAFYDEILRHGDECIGCRNYRNYDNWRAHMLDRHNGTNLPQGFVQEDFYLCYDGDVLVGVFSLKYTLTDYLLHYGGHVGYAVRPSQRRKGYATQMLHQGLDLARQLGLTRLLCVCNSDNTPSEKTILANGGKLENILYDPEEQTDIKRFWIEL